MEDSGQPLNQKRRREALDFADPFPSGPQPTPFQTSESLPSITQIGPLATATKSSLGLAAGLERSIFPKPTNAQPSRWS